MHLHSNGEKLTNSDSWVMAIVGVVRIISSSAQRIATLHSSIATTELVDCLLV